MKKLISILGLVALLTGCAAEANAGGFSDTDSHKYKSAIEYIADQGIVQGYEDGSFRPDEKINRAELLKIVMEANEASVGGSDCFSDVKDEWFAKYVCKAKEMGIVKGYEDGSYKPDANVNFVEALKIMQLAYGADIKEGDPWYQGYVDEAKKKGMIPSEISDYGTEITRGQMAYMVMQQLKNGSAVSNEKGFKVVDTAQNSCYGGVDSIDCPAEGGKYYGQDAQYSGNQPSYKDNGDGTVTDLNTGLMWQQDPGSKMTYSEAIQKADSFELAGYDDWRVPTIKELYSLMDFRGTDPSGSSTAASAVPFVDDEYFEFYYGDESAGDRFIDSQWVTSNVYKSEVMGGEECFFGVNFADGRIKCYPTGGRISKGYFAIYVRGETGYGENDFVDNGDGTVTDSATGLTWTKQDSGDMNWEESLAYCEKLEVGEKSDWRVPNAKELQGIVDYSRSPDTTNSAAIDSVFEVSSITNEAGDKDYPFYWSSTTHVKDGGRGDNAAYVSFGRALGYMSQFGGWVDVHGAGAQRSDPKVGDPSEYPQGHGPQGDAIRVYNYVRCVRGGVEMNANTEKATGTSSSSEPASSSQPSGGAGAPPQEAIDACSGKSEGNSCSFTTPNGTISGVCRSPQGELACVPSQ